MPSYAQRYSEYQHLYGRRWRNASKAFKQANPLCVMCEREGRATPAQVTDHIKPHKGDLDLFWNPDNWQALCKQHHDSHKQSIEKGGKGKPAIGADGWPI